MPDPKFGSELVAKFINYVMDSGKKSVAEKIVYGALLTAAEKLKDKTKEELKESSSEEAEEKKPLYEEVEEKKKNNEVSVMLKMFDKVLDKVCPTVEVKSCRIGGSTYQVPVEVRVSRRLALAMRWLIEAAKKRNEKTMILRLSGEMVDAFSGRGAAVKKREDMHRMAAANQAFASYVW